MRYRTLATAAALAWTLAALGASAQGTDNSPVANPTWVATASKANFAFFYPEKAQRMHTEGDATAICTVGADGSLGDCKIVAETSPSFGFGAATIRVAKFFRVSPTDRDGHTIVGRSVLVPISWKLNGGSAFAGPAPQPQP
jgi:TonB family protein